MRAHPGPFGSGNPALARLIQTASHSGTTRAAQVCADSDTLFSRAHAINPANSLCQGAFALGFVPGAFFFLN